MIGYGLPRNGDVEFPDKADGNLYGLKGSRRRTDAKARARRIWKKAARREALANQDAESK